jgi:DnaJ-domain-containing protein 1
MEFLAPTMQFVLFTFLMLGAFSTKQKLAPKSQIQKSNEKLRMFLLKKVIWSTVDGFLLPQNEKKFNEIHKTFSQFPTKFENISKKEFGAKGMSWVFFEHFQTQKIFAQNVCGLISRRCVREYNHKVKRVSDLSKDDECHELLSSLNQKFEVVSSNTSIRYVLNLKVKTNHKIESCF